MAKCKIYTLKDLEETGLKIFDSCRYVDTKVGELYLKASVINMWDWSDYSDFYTYRNESGINFVVNIGFKEDDKFYKEEKLKKDLSNIDTFKQEKEK